MFNQFEKELAGMSDEVLKRVTKLFQQGIFDTNEIRGVMEQAGFYDLETAWVDSYADVIKLNQDVAKEIGKNFILSDKMVNAYDLITEANVERLHIQNEVYITDMKQKGVAYLLEGKSFSDTAFKTEITDALNGMQRRLAAEAYTGIYQADSAIKKDFFEQAGIDKYYYDGPNDNVTRDVCLATLGDPRQQTGWTMADIQSSQTPFIERGGYNCRHEWLPLVEVL
jgi:hypothetical protein